MKRIMTIFCCMLVLLTSGCSSYKRDTSAGKVEKITIEQMEQKIKNKETFTILFTQSWCGNCQTFLTMLEDYLPNHHVVVYDLVFDKDPITDQKERLERVQKVFPSMTATPIVYYVEKGELKSELTSDDDGLTQSRFDDWVQKNEIDKIEK